MTPQLGPGLRAAELGVGRGKPMEKNRCVLAGSQRCGWVGVGSE